MIPELNTIINGDCLTILKTLPDKCVDIVFYDPPYNIGKPYDGYEDNLDEYAYIDLMHNVARECERVSRNGVVIYIAGKLTRLFGNIYPDAHLIIVEKRAAGVLAGNYMLQYHSLYSTVTPILKCKDLWNDVRLPGEGYFFKENRYDHPGLTGLDFTQKVITTFTNEGDTVLDPFMGSGTTAVACIKTQRNYIGIEQSEKYCAIARKRVSETDSKLGDFF
jgi:DNA modification methylase